MTWTRDLLYGVAQFLADNSIGVFRAGAYGPDVDTSISLGMTIDEPVKSIGLMSYSPVDSPSIADVRQPVQFRIRGTVDATSCDVIGDGIFDVLHGVGPLTLNGVHVVLATRRSVLPLGTDADNRWMASHNYYFDAMRPTASRPD